MMISRATNSLAVMAVVLTLGAALPAAAEIGAKQKAVADHLAAAAKSADPAFAGFSAERGKQFFQGRHTGGKPDSPSCTSCHTADLKQPGRTRAGKEIAPMAASANPQRYTDIADVEKWLKRNCSDVLGRECTPLEKGDVVTYLLGL